MFNLWNRVKDMAVTITGTGSYTLAGSPPTGFQSFAAASGGVAGRVIYEANDGAGNWEVNVGTFNGTTGLTRDMLIKSSTGSAISWSAATPTIFVTAPASLLKTLGHPGFNRGRWYGSNLVGNSMISGVSNGASGGGVLSVLPLFVPDFCTITGIGIGVTANAAGTVNLGIYGPGDGVPGALLYDSGPLTVAVGSNQASLSLQVSPGILWVATLFSAGNLTVLGNVSNDVGARAAYLGYSSPSDTGSARANLYITGQSSPLTTQSASAWNIGTGSLSPNVVIQVT